jgi:hypothetical protein
MYRGQRRCIGQGKPTTYPDECVKTHYRLWFSSTNFPNAPLWAALVNSSPSQSWHLLISRQEYLEKWPESSQVFACSF